MGDLDTSIGGGRRRFDTTQWSRIADYQRGSAEERRKILEDLIRLYWKPVYYQIRLQWGRSNEDSKDHTQRFFAWLIDGDALDRLQQERGRFRSFLKVVIRNFMANETEAERAVKRGGGRMLVTLEEMSQADRELPGPGEDPAEVMDREWRRVLLSRALEQLRGLYLALGKEVHYEVFRVYAFEGDAGPSRREVAGRYGITETDVKNYVADGRRRFGQIVRDLVAETVADADLLQAELRELFGKDAPS